MASVLIIGSSRGIGLELARQYLEDGWRVYGTTRTGEVPAALAGLGNQPTVFRLDVTKQDQIDALAESLAHAPIDVLIVSAGTFDRVGGLSGNGAAVPEAEVFATNSTGPMNVAEAVFPNLKASGRGRMIFISSAEGSRRFGIPRSAYGRSKAALNDAVRYYAPAWASHGVLGLALHPGWVRTDMGGANGPVSPQDSARGIRWIADGMGPEHNGGFYSYQGRPLPW